MTAKITADIFTFIKDTHSYLNSWITDGSFTMANSNSFLVPSIVFFFFFSKSSKNKYSGKFSYFIKELFVVCYQGGSNEYTQHTIIVLKIKQKKSKLLPFASWPGAMINPQWLELAISQTNFKGPKDIREI